MASPDPTAAPIPLIELAVTLEPQGAAVVARMTTPASKRDTLKALLAVCQTTRNMAHEILSEATESCPWALPAMLMEFDGQILDSERAVDHMIFTRHDADQPGEPT